MNEARNYIVRILNDQYTLCSDESEELIVQSSDLVNLFIREIIDRNKQMEHKKVAVLAALRMASRIVQLESQLHEAKNREEAVAAALAALDERLPSPDVE
jgi:cell division protein ZapA (FtsZ GTPase activity inhibitor)